MANPWLVHVKAEAKKHKGKKFKDILRLAKKTYKKKASGKRVSKKAKKRTKKRRHR